MNPELKLMSKSGYVTSSRFGFSVRKMSDDRSSLTGNSLKRVPTVHACAVGSSPSLTKKFAPRLTNLCSADLNISVRTTIRKNMQTCFSKLQMVVEELQKLKMDREARQKKKDRLIKELETLRKQQGELLRKKRREKDGHKDPILVELGRLQEDVMEQISLLRGEHEEAEKKHEELVKVATILGLDHKKIQISVERELSPPQSRSKETDRSLEKPKDAASSASAKGTKTPVPASDAQTPDTSAELFEYYDAGNHWCRNCNSTSGSMFDFFTHLHSKTHRKTLDPYDRPWAEKSEKSEKKHTKDEPISKPAKGSEFLIPVRGFYCLLCRNFFGDPICAETHVISHAHNEKYKKQMYENPLYEQRRNLDRQAGMDSEKKKGDLKRKHEDDDSPKQEPKKSKAVKDDIKNPKGKDEDVDIIKHNKEEAPKAKGIKKGDSKPKYAKEEYERSKYRKEEEESDRYAREEEERGQYRKNEEDKYRHRRDEEDRYRYEEDRYRYREESRYKYKDDDRYRYKKDEEKYKYGRDEEKKYKYGREAEEGRLKSREEEGVKWPKSKWEDEEEEEEVVRTKYEKKDKRQKDLSSRRKDEKETASAKDSKTEPEKPIEPPKVMCGPSPAIFAKLRKKSEDSATRPTFGKFNWKKTEKTALEKEAEKIAAQFIKEDEAAAAAQDEALASDSEAFAKSVAAAKNIAIKLSGKTVIPPSNEWVAFNQNKPRPTLPPPPSPSNILRKTNIGLQKSAPLKTIASDGSSTKAEKKEPVLSAELISKAFQGEEVQLNLPGNNSTDPEPSTSTATTLPPPLAMTSTTMPIPLPSSTILATAPLPSPLCTTSTTTPIPPPSATTLETAPLPPPIPTLTMEVMKVQPMPPKECVVSLKSDVAAPGVPEEEQNLTVVVRPPPQLQAKVSETLKSDKPKRSLAAAKAKDLFDIFYSSSSAMASASATKKVVPKAQAEDTKKDQGSDLKESSEVMELKCEEPSENPATESEQQAEKEPNPSQRAQADKDAETLEISQSEIGKSIKGPRFNTEMNSLESTVNAGKDTEILEISKSEIGESMEVIGFSTEVNPQECTFSAGKDAQTLEISQNEIGESTEGIGFSTEVSSLECEVNTAKDAETLEIAKSEIGESVEEIGFSTEINSPECEINAGKGTETLEVSQNETCESMEEISFSTEVNSPECEVNSGKDAETLEISKSEIRESMEGIGLSTEAIPLECEVNSDKDTETLEISKSEIGESMEGIGFSTEVNSLECVVNPEILENIVIMETSDNQDGGNALNPEEVLTVSFSPPPGSFTEQINLDTFEFSFEPL